MNVFFLSNISPFVFENTHFYIITNILRCKLPHVFVCMVHYDVHNSCYGLIAEGCFRQLGASLWMETEKISFFFLKYRKNRALSPYSYSFTVCHVLWIYAQIFTCSCVSNCCVQISAIRYHHRILHKKLWKLFYPINVYINLD